MLEHAKSTNSLLGKAFQKQIKTIKDAAEKKTKAIEGSVEKQIEDTYQNSITNFLSKGK